MGVRVASFDIARAIALLAVIAGHTSFAGFPTSVVDFCYSFDMPLFFIVSGYFCKEKQLTVGYIKKNMINLIRPYIATGLIVVLLMVFRSLVWGGDIVKTGFSWLLAVLYGAGGNYETTPFGIIGIGAIWYLLALFWGKLLLAAAHESKYPAFVSIILFIIGVSTKDNIWLPFSVQPALCATLFLYIGQIVRSKELLISKQISPLLWLCLLMTWLYCGVYYGQLYMVSNTYAHGIIDIIGGVAGSLCVIKGAMLFERRYRQASIFLAWIGRNTLPLFCMHLVELNVVPWDSVITWSISIGIESWVTVFIAHLALTLVLTLLIYISPKPLSSIYFRKR